MGILIIFLYSSFFDSTEQASVVKRPRLNSEAPPTPPPQNRAVSNIGTTGDGRIVEQYNTSIVVEYYGNWFAESLAHLRQIDMNISMIVPNVSTDTTESTVYGLIGFSEFMAMTFQSTIFRLLNNPRKLIKYQSNCGELVGLESDLSVKPYVHPSVVEFAFTRRAASYGLGPLALLLSPPVRLCASRSGKCHFLMSDEEFDECRSDPNSSLRYMIMDRVDGDTLFEYSRGFANGTIPFARAMEIAADLIRLLERLHTEADIGHGDIHESNIMLESGTGNLKLIDFARSYSIGDRQSKKIRPTLWSIHPLYSYRELAGFTPVAIDDVHRAVETIARLMNPTTAYNDHLEIMSAENPAWILEWKFRANIFKIPSRDGASWEPNDPVRNLGLDEDATSMIELRLLDVLNVLRHPKPAEPIPYASIREAFATCHRIATR